MSAFLIVNYDIENPELYGESQRLEGETSGHQTVVLKFDSMEKAREIYESGEYQAMVGKRLEGTSKHFAVLVNGLG